MSKANAGRYPLCCVPIHDGEAVELSGVSLPYAIRLRMVESPVNGEEAGLGARPGRWLLPTCISLSEHATNGPTF